MNVAASSHSYLCKCGGELFRVALVSYEAVYEEIWHSYDLKLLWFCALQTSKKVVYTPSKHLFLPLTLKRRFFCH